MNHFFVKLIPPRPTFNKDMNKKEEQTMHYHTQYWSELMRQGFVIVYGPVMDMNGLYGMGVLDVENEQQAIRLMSKDPCVKDGLMKVEIAEMKAIFKKE